MNAIKQIRKFLENDPTGESSLILARLAASLAEEKEFSLADLYRLNYEAFSLAIELLKDWRLDRYYAARIRLFDVILNEVLPEGSAPLADAHPAATAR